MRTASLAVSLGLFGATAATSCAAPAPHCVDFFQPVTATGTDPGAPVSARLVVQGLGTWSYATRLHLEKVDGAWKVDVTPETIEPDLMPGGTIVRIA